MKHGKLDQQEALNDALYLARVVAYSIGTAVAWLVIIGTVLS